MINNLQALRGLAALFVVLVHLSRYDWDRLGAPLMFGHYGVDIFFVISGFVMVYSTAKRSYGPAAFFSSRIARIVPIYWALTLLVYSLSFVAPSLLKTTSTDPGGLLKSLFFIPYRKQPGADLLPILFPGWTLNYEMFFYSLFALALIIPQRKVQIFGVIAVLVGLVIAGAIINPHGDIARFYTSTLLLEFGWGMLIAYFYPVIAARKLPLAVGIATLSAGLILIVAILPPMAAVAARGVQAGLAASLVVSGTLIIETHGWVVRSKTLLLLGASSYSLYLTHAFVMDGFGIVARRFDLNQGMMLPVFMVTTLVAASLIAIVVHLGFERPVDSYLRHRLRRSDSDGMGDDLALWPWRRRANKP